MKFFDIDSGEIYPVYILMWKNTKEDLTKGFVLVRIKDLAVGDKSYNRLKLVLLIKYFQDCPLVKSRTSRHDTTRWHW